MKPVQSFYRDCAEKTLREAMSMSVYCHAHPLTSLRNIFRKQNVVTSSNLRRIPSGATVRVSGMLILVHTPPTKSGKRVMFLTLEDEMGLFEVVVFSKAQDRFAKLILTSEVLILLRQIAKIKHIKSTFESNRGRFDAGHRAERILASILFAVLSIFRKSGQDIADASIIPGSLDLSDKTGRCRFHSLVPPGPLN
jgi:error-prone DNA polymerase